MTWYWPYEYAVRSSNMCVIFLKAGLGVPAIGSFRTNNGKEKKKILLKRLTLVDLFEGLWSVGTSFLH